MVFEIWFDIFLDFIIIIIIKVCFVVFILKDFWRQN